jgi:DNA-binding transcriptional MerR regulator
MKNKDMENVGKQNKGQREDGKLMSRREVSELFGVTAQTIANYASRGILKEVTDSKHHFLTRESVERVLEDMRMDDTMRKEIAGLHKELEEEKASAKQHLREAEKSNTIISLLGSKGGRDAVVTVIRSMGYRHLSESIVRSAIAFLEGWNIERMRGEFGAQSMQSMRVRLYRVLKTLKSLPSYSDLENEIEDLKEERDGLKFYVGQLEAERAHLAEQLDMQTKAETDPDMAKLRLYGRGVEELNIRTKDVRALFAYGIEKVGDLVKLSFYDLLRVKSLGRTGRCRIEEALEAWGLSLREVNQGRTL